MLAWWTFGSRVSRREKWQGLVGLTVLTGLGLFLIHPTLRGMPSVVNIIPSAVAGFGLGVVLLHRQPRRRIIAALILTALGVGYWNLQRSEGITGSFQLQTLWRWQPSAEESYLQELAGQSVHPVTEAQQSDLLVSAWPGFRGQHRDASIPGVTVSEDWQSTPPQRLWQRRIGPGWSSFCMAGNRLFTQEQRGELEAVVCLDADTGETLWDVSYRSRFWEAAAGAGPRATPTITDEGLFALGANGTLLCIDPLTGDQLWERDLRLDASREPPDWGFSASPLVTDGLVIVHAGGDSEQGLFAYRTRDGELQWSVPSGDHTLSLIHISEPTRPY